jgi:hypothetical protein
MKKLRLLAQFLFALPLSAFAQQTGDRPPALDCSAGPISKNFGATPWLVYACSDGKSVVAVSVHFEGGVPCSVLLGD